MKDQEVAVGDFGISSHLNEGVIVDDPRLELRLTLGMIGVSARIQSFDEALDGLI
jgi:hypothetical protein